MQIGGTIRYLGLRAATALRAKKHGWHRVKGVRVWMLHGVVERFADRSLEHNFTTMTDFRECVTVFRRLNAMGLEELRAHLEVEGETPENGVLITFDDGYRNNLAACELLAKSGLKAAVFVCPGIPKGRTIWPAEVTLLVLQGGRRSLEVLGRRWELSDPAARLDACRRIRAEMKRLPATKRVIAQEELEAQFPPGTVEELLSRFPSLMLLTAEEVRQLATAGISIASHGMHHEIHHDKQHSEVLRKEIVDSKSAIEKCTGQKCAAFAYPNGEYSSASIQLLKDSGFRLAFTTRRGCLTGHEDPFLLPRMEGSRIQAAVRDAFYLAERI